MREVAGETTPVASGKQRLGRRAGEAGGWQILGCQRPLAIPCMCTQPCHPQALQAKCVPRLVLALGLPDDLLFDLGSRGGQMLPDWPCCWEVAVPECLPHSSLLIHHCWSGRQHRHTRAHTHCIHVHPHVDPPQTTRNNSAGRLLHVEAPHTHGQIQIESHAFVPRQLGCATQLHGSSTVTCFSGAALSQPRARMQPQPALLGGQRHPKAATASKPAVPPWVWPTWWGWCS